MRTVSLSELKKGFLGEGNALIMAKQGDSIYYGDDLDVKVQRLNGSGSQEYTETLVRKELDIKDEGVFEYPKEIIYRASKNLIVNDETKSYKITVKNKKTGYQATSSSKCIKNLDLYFGITKFGGGNDSMDFRYAQTLNFLPSAIGKFYQVIFTIKYYEISPGNDTVLKTFDWNFGETLFFPEMTRQRSFTL